MERLNFQAIEKKWQSIFEKEKLYNNKSSKKFYCLKCFLIHQEKFIWVMLEIIQ